MEQAAESIDEPAFALLEGTSDTDTFITTVMSALSAAHTQAAWLGRLRAGGTGGITAADRALGTAQSETQRTFLMGFASDVANGQQSHPQIVNRANAYGQRLVGTANLAWKNYLPAEESIDWIDTGDAGECDGCDQLAGNGPYTSETLTAVPGDGSTPCGTNCRCYLETSSGKRSFYNPEEAALNTRKAA